VLVARLRGWPVFAKYRYSTWLVFAPEGGINPGGDPDNFQPRVELDTACCVPPRTAAARIANLLHDLCERRRRAGWLGHPDPPTAADGSGTCSVTRRSCSP
jgi:hypothetical protein